MNPILLRSSRSSHLLLQLFVIISWAYITVSYQYVNLLENANLVLKLNSFPLAIRINYRINSQDHNIFHFLAHTYYSLICTLLFQKQKKLITSKGCCISIPCLSTYYCFYLECPFTAYVLANFDIFFKIQLKYHKYNEAVPS